MSFSRQVKEQLATHKAETTNQRRRELQGFYWMLGTPSEDQILFASENILVAKMIIRLLGEFFHGLYSFKVQYKGRFRKVHYQITLYGKDQSFFKIKELEKKQERAAFLRAAFLARGSLTDPKKGYHLELRCQDFNTYILLQDLLFSFGVEAKGITRKEVFFLYLKDGEMISDFLKIVGAVGYMLAFEETRVIKEMKNMANRRNNCDLANLDKIIKSSAKQVRIIQRISIPKLPQNLRELAALRVENPELSLQELGDLCSPPLKKAAVNYRFKKIIALGGEE